MPTRWLHLQKGCRTFVLGHAIQYAVRFLHIPAM
jgi:hypothetical protein